MKNSNRYNSRNLQSRFSKILRRKVFLSNQLKKSLLVAYYEAKKNQTCVNLDLLLYGLLSQPKSLACRLFLTVLSQYKNDKNLSLRVLDNKLINKQNLKDQGLKELSVEILNENKKTPWLMPEVRQTIINSIKLALQSKKKVVIITTKNVFFDLLNNEIIRDSIRKLVD